MNGVTTGSGVAVSGVAGAFFCLRPSGFSAPERRLLQWLLTGCIWICVVYACKNGCAVLPAPFRATPASAFMPLRGIQRLAADISSALTAQRTELKVRYVPEADFDKF